MVQQRDVVHYWQAEDDGDVVMRSLFVATSHIGKFLGDAASTLARCSPASFVAGAGGRAGTFMELRAFRCKGHPSVQPVS